MGDMNYVWRPGRGAQGPCFANPFLMMVDGRMLGRPLGHRCGACGRMEKRVPQRSPDDPTGPPEPADCAGCGARASMTMVVHAQCFQLCSVN